MICYILNGCVWELHPKVMDMHMKECEELRKNKVFNWAIARIDHFDTILRNLSLIQSHKTDF